MCAHYLRRRSSIHTYIHILFQYDKYNTSIDFAEEAMAAERAFVADCVNASIVALIKNGTSPTVYNNSAYMFNISASCLKSFKFDTNNQPGCMRDGLGGPQSMMCYKALAVPKFASKSSGSLRCSECGKWLPSKETLTFIAEEEVQAGAVLYFSFGMDKLALRAPLQGVHVCMFACVHM